MLDIKISPVNDIAGTQVLTISGNFDILEKESIVDNFARVLSSAPSHLIVDLSNVLLIDSSGIGLLIAYYLKLGRLGTSMAMVISSDNYLLNKLKQMGIFSDTGIKLFGSVDDAKTALGSG